MSQIKEKVKKIKLLKIKEDICPRCHEKRGDNIKCDCANVRHRGNKKSICNFYNIRNPEDLMFDACGMAITIKDYFKEYDKYHKY